MGNHGRAAGDTAMALRVVSEQSEANIRKQRVHDQLTRDLRRFAANFLRMTSGSGKPLDLLPQMERLTGSIRAYADARDGVLSAPKVIHQILDSHAAKLEYRPWIKDVSETERQRWEADGSFDRSRAVAGIIKAGLRMVASEQKVANVIVEVEDGKPARIVQASGSYLHFDQKGKVHDFLQQGAFEAMETYDALERSKRIKPSKVVDLAPKLKREKWERDNRWTPSKQDLDLISDDIWKRKRAATPKVQQAKGVAPKPPPMTFEAKEAIREIQTHIYGIDGKMEFLTKPALKGFAFEARRLAKNDFDNAVWRGVAEAADRRREILARYCTGSGVWYASVDVIRWDNSRHSGESDSVVHERCNSKKEAEEAARRLLAKNAKYFSAENSVETRVVCDLEWDDAASAEGDE